MRKLVLISATLTLLLTIVFTFANFFIAPPPPRISDPLAMIIPKEIEGWTVKDIPLAETEEMRKKVDEILRFDDYVSRQFTRLSDKAEIIVYIAYWKPKSASVMEVNTHNPDICWTANGWEKLPVENKMTTLNEVKTGQYRKFIKSGITTEVIFWHIVGNQVYVNEGVISKRYKMDSLVAPLKLGTNIRNDQIFIRISSSSNIPLQSKELLQNLQLLQFLELPENT